MAKTGNGLGAGPWARAARAANMRQNVMAPVTAILGYSEMLHEEAAGAAGVAHLRPDLDRIQSAAQLLCVLSERMLDPQGDTDLPAGADLEALHSRICHDLRNPLNVLKGYSEMLIEDAPDHGGTVLVPDLERLLDETNRLLGQLSAITGEAPAGVGPGDAEAAGMVAHLEEVLHPLSRNRRRKALPGRILVVDDNDSNRDLLARRLSKEGHRADTAEEGLRALELVRTRAYDLILLDLMMPGLSGYEVLVRLKGEPGSAEIPVIMVSALHEMDSVVRCIEAGADDYLPKPVNPTLLGARIDASLERHQAHARERRYLEQIEEEKRKNEVLLLNILPAGIVERMHVGEPRIADRFDNVTVLFADLVDFSVLSASVSAQELVDSLNRLFSEFDAATTRIGVEKIKTIGDAYMAAAGLPQPRPDHAEACVRLARAMLEAMERVNREAGHAFVMRIGIHSGLVVAGVIGSHKFAYDVWGDTVNIASRMESHGIPGRIHLSAHTAGLLAGRFPLEARGRISVKGRGAMETFLLAETGQGAPAVTTTEDGSEGSTTA
jgi:class 3 adenylate cyclase